jgi:hypothetical protein
MRGTGLFTVIVVFITVFASIYRIQTLHKKKIWNLSIQQLIHLVLIPGILFPMIFSYLLHVTQLPRSEAVFLSDTFLVDTVLLSILFAYGGIAIHAVTKMLQEYLQTESEARQINAFFHTTFSHNMAYGGVVLASLGLTLLELNHISPQAHVSYWGGLLRGLLLGGSFFLAVFNYTRYTGGDYGRWNDLKVTFGVIWVAFAVLLYAIQRFDPRFSEYQLLLPMLLSFSIMAVLSLVLVFRRLKRGRWRVDVERKELERYLSLEERAS